LFSEINRSRGKFYLANAVTLGIYGALYVIFRANPIGKLTGSNFPGTGMSFLLTLLTLGLYPGVMLPVLAYKLAPAAYPPLGHLVLALNLTSLVAAMLSGGLFIAISIALWAHAAWLVAGAADIVAMEKASNNSFKAAPLRGRP
jgi:hypothetical protein